MDSKNRGLGEGFRRFPLLPFGLLLTASGVLLLAWIAWLVWHDVTVWGKDVVSLLFDPRAGEAISLGIGVKASHYLFLGLTLLFIGPITLIFHSANSLSIKLESWDFSYTEPSESFPSQLKTKISFNILNDGFFSVNFRNVDVKLNISNVNVSSFFTESEYMIPRYGWCQLEVNCSLTGDEADALRSTKERDILLALRGEASSLFYKVPVSLSLERVRRHIFLEREDTVTSVLRSN